MIFIVSGNSKSSGVNIYNDSLYSSLKKIGHEVYILSFKESIYKIYQLFISNVIFKRKKYFIFITWGLSNLLPLPSNSQLCILHGFPAKRTQGFFKQLIITFIIHTIKLRNLKAITVSNYSKSILHDIYCLKTTVICNPLPYNVFKNFKEKKDTLEELSKKKIDILFVGRAIKLKLPNRTIEIMEKFATNKNKVQIVGSGDSAIAYQKQHPNSQIKFTGNLPYKNVQRYFKLAKVFISCSESEPFGFVYIEALMQGCIIVSPYSGGALEISNRLGNISKKFFNFYENEKDLEKILERAIFKAKIRNKKNFERSLNSLRLKILEDFSPLIHGKKIINFLRP